MARAGGDARSHCDPRRDPRLQPRRLGQPQVTTLDFTTTAMHGLDYLRSDAYFAERVAGTGGSKATAYRRARELLKPYRSAILFPEALLLPPAGDDLRR